MLAPAHQVIRGWRGDDFKQLDQEGCHLRRDRGEIKSTPGSATDHRSLLTLRRPRLLATRPPAAHAHLIQFQVIHHSGSSQSVVVGLLASNCCLYLFGAHGSGRVQRRVGTVTPCRPRPGVCPCAPRSGGVLDHRLARGAIVLANLFSQTLVASCRRFADVGRSSFLGEIEAVRNGTKSRAATSPPNDDGGVPCSVRFSGGSQAFGLSGHGWAWVFTWRGAGGARTAACAATRRRGHVVPPDGSPGPRAEGRGPKA